MAPAPVLVIVNGAPGTGKTTLSKKLAKDLGLPCLNKDDVKELLYDKLGVGDLKWSQDMGAGVSEMLFAFIERWVGRGRSLIAESAYYHEFAAPRFAGMLKTDDILFVEVYCKTDPEVRKQRFVARNENGQRHPGHVDRNFYGGESDEAVDAKYAPLKLGELLEVDTTSFDDETYKELVGKIQAFIAENQKEGNL